MAIINKLKEILNRKGFTIVELAGKVGITPGNMSNIVNGKISAIRIETLEKICATLKIQPGDMLEYHELEKKRIIPLFLDYSGTTDHLLSGGAENVKAFFEAIKELETKSNCIVQITMVTGSALESAKSKYMLLDTLADNAGLPSLFDGAVAEYCGFLIKKDGTINLRSLDPRIIEKRSEIIQIVNKYNGIINPDVSSMYNVFFDKITREDLDNACIEVEHIIADNEIETVSYYDEYGKEFDIKPRIHTKSEAVYMVFNRLNKKYDIPFVIIGGDSQEEDLKMYTQNKERIEKTGIPSFFIAPSNIGELTSKDNNIIIGNWENSDGITDCIKTISSMVRIRDDGGVEI